MRWYYFQEEAFNANGSTFQMRNEYAKIYSSIDARQFLLLFQVNRSTRLKRERAEDFVWDVSPSDNQRWVTMTFLRRGWEEGL
jgi:hypothetical protein